MPEITSWQYAKNDVSIAEGGISSDRNDKGNYIGFDKSKTFVGTRYGVTYAFWFDNIYDGNKTLSEKELIKNSRLLFQILMILLKCLKLFIGIKII